MSKYGNKPGWYDKDLNPVPKEQGVIHLDSRLEYQFARRRYMEGLKCEREPEKWTWTQEHSYKPDFRVTLANGTVRFVECKGYNYPGSLAKIRRFKDKPLFIFTGAEVMTAKDYLERMKGRKK